ncbi:Transcriptional regulator [Collimonas arenae]|uniref:Transcriptional regulator n=1 Tax=Collimonas arenae TaxID=279058 RepID=A0A0A1FIT3_9BURK|nr:TetR/AcrR family transcriptional regulator [Collimonas arenae]AIY42747.1 Transcriptional regulator [Collimonas arenae]
MARPKEFENEVVLEKAIEIFSTHGYEGTSTDELLQVMGISRQSMYNTFGDKKRLYLEALQRYVVGSVNDQIDALSAPASPMMGVEALMDFAVSRAVADPEPKCLGISAICEFGRADSEVTMITEMASKIFISSLERRLVEAKKEGEIGEEIGPQAAAQFLLATLTGIKVAARAGATEENLRGIARIALRGIR